MDDIELGPLASAYKNDLEQKQAEERGAQALVGAIREQLPQVELTEQEETAKANQLLGMMQYGLFMDSVNRLTLLKTLKKLKEQKAYKGMLLTGPDNKTQEIRTWEQLCSVMGLSRRTVDEDLANLAAFGESMLEAQQKMGVGYRELRGLRGTIAELPEEKRVEVQQLIEDAVASGDPENIYATLDEIGSRNKRLTDEIKAAKADAEAARKVAADANSSRMKALEELERIKHPRTENDHQTLLRLRRETHIKTITEQCQKITGMVVQLARMVSANPEVEGDPLLDADTMARINRQVSVMCQNMRDTLLDSGADVDFAAVYGADPMALDDENQVEA